MRRESAGGRPRPVGRVGGVVLAALLALPAANAAAGSFENFESGHVRPLALSPAGDLLFAVNTPDGRLAVYTVAPSGLTLAAEVPVGLEPVAVAARTNAAGFTEAWVVNHLPDSVSVVEVDGADATRSRVRRTLHVGDEPRDVVFAGPGGTRAFVTAAHRWQNRVQDPQLTTAGVPRADVWVFDVANPGAALSGTPLVVLEMQGDTPRALAATADGATVYAAVFFSGNQTVAVPEPTVTNGLGLPPPPAGGRLDGPNTGLIVRLNPATGKWEDELWQDWSAAVPMVLPDKDVFVIDAAASPPVLAAGTNAVPGVGTVLFNMAVRPGTSTVYVSNTEARNEVRFEPELRGHVTDTQITVVAGGLARRVDLNPHIKYGTIPGPAAEVNQSLAFPMGMVFSADGKTLYVAAFGSGKIGALDADKLEAGTTLPRTLVPVGGGPSGLVLDEANDRLYVMNRFDHTISIVSDASDLSKIGTTGTVSLRFSPEPPDVRDGRRFLYDATTSSAHGDAACASCHVFGDLDGLAWDLGNPFDMTTPANPNPFRLAIGGPSQFHPKKGPMTTQSLRGMADAGPMHWRGDKTGGSTGGDPLDEMLAFKEFEGAFQSLLGGTISDMDAFARFILTVRYPPNPVRALDDSLSPAEAAGRDFFTNTPVDAGLTCAFCHVLPLGTDGLSSFDAEPQVFKIPHLRNMYAKIGRFGMPSGGAFNVPPYTAAGEQVRAFGFLHDGGVSSLDDFFHANVFAFSSQTQRDELVAFMLAFDTGLAPAVGQQVTATPTSHADATVVARIALLLARADAGDCDLVVKGVSSGEARGWLHVATTGPSLFRSDRASEPLVCEATLRAQSATSGQELTYTCVPPPTTPRSASTTSTASTATAVPTVSS
jgi:DNA-binding beta-propeller fold protein YncE